MNEELNLKISSKRDLKIHVPASPSPHSLAAQLDLMHSPAELAGKWLWMAPHGEVAFWSGV